MIFLDEQKHFLCRPCRRARTVGYPEGPETCARLPEHSICDGCGQVMEEFNPPLDAMHADRIMHQHGVTQAEIDAAVAAGRLTVYAHPEYADEAPHYFEDEVRACFGKPSKAWPPRDAKAAAPPTS